MGRILKICWGPWENASRDKRELSVYRELGHEVLVMASGNTDDRGRKDTIETFPVERWGVTPLGQDAPVKVNQILSLIAWGRYARKYHPDVISGHDFTGWIVGWMANLFRKNKPVFIYDAHEFELGRNAKRNRIRTLLIQSLEKFIIHHSAFSIMVNDSIADEIQRVYKLKERPIVVRSTPNYWEIDEKVCQETRFALLNKFSEGGVKRLLMYHGGVIPGRGIERIIEALSILEKKVGLIILGNGNSQYIDSLKSLAEKTKVDERIYFHPAVPLNELWKYVGAVDISCSPIELVAKNHYYSLPNKFFESIQSMTPIIASEVPEMKRIIEKYEIGLTCKPGDANDLANCVRTLLTDNELYRKIKRNMIKAKNDLCWEKEKQILAEAYRKEIGEVRDG